jgi:hypothetical protein
MLRLIKHSALFLCLLVTISDAVVVTFQNGAASYSSCRDMQINTQYSASWNDNNGSPEYYSE